MTTFRNIRPRRFAAPRRSRRGLSHGHADPTQAIPPVLAGRDLMGCAQTGTGKTAAFALPTLHRLSATRANAGGCTTDNPAPSRNAESMANRRSDSRPPIRVPIVARSAR